MKTLSKMCNNVSLMLSGAAAFNLLAYGGYTEPDAFLAQALSYFFFACLLASLSGFLDWQGES